MQGSSGAALPIELFDYELPEASVAQRPAQPRDLSRLLVLERGSAVNRHACFLNLGQHLRPGDLLVVNRSRVIPARLRLRKTTGGHVEVLPYRPEPGVELRSARRWLALARPAKGLRLGTRLLTAMGAAVRVEERQGDSVWVAAEEPIWQILQREGQVPLPPYVSRPADASDAADYQTMFARTDGSVAAPTASLHFTERVCESLRARGVAFAEVLLHVGPGTFLPVRDEHYEDVRGHSMHAEWYEVPDETLRQIEAARGRGGRVVAVGTTSVRALESWAAYGAASGETRLFIYPGATFSAVDALITNFHLPRSTLLMLVCAFAGRERVMAAYREALAAGYRFFSYGDAMLVV